ncbi:MAG: prohibitin family protein [Rhodospirillales bacterium]
MSASLFDATHDEPDATPAHDARGRRMARLTSFMHTGGRTSAWIIGFLLLALVVLWQRVIYVVPAGGAGVMWQMFFGGTVTDYVYGEGLHIMFPWDRFTVYDTRVQVVESDFTTLTNKGLAIELKLTIRFHPDYDTVALLDQRVGKEYVSKVVKPTVESVLRRYIGREEPESIYTNKEGVLSSIISRAIAETSEQFVSIDDVIIRQVVLPETLRDAIGTKLIYQQQAEGYEFRLAGEKQEAERKRIEAQGISDSQNIIKQGLTPELLRWEAIRVEGELAKSANAKLLIMNGPDSRQININVP